MDRAVWKWECAPLNDRKPQLLYQIAIPEAGLGTNIGEQVDNGVIPLPMPREHELVVLSLVRLQEIRPEYFLEGVTVLDGWSISETEMLCVTVHIDAVKQSDSATWIRFAEINPALFDAFEGATEDELGRFDPRAFILDDQRDGVGRVIDFGVRELAMWAAFQRSA